MPPVWHPMVRKHPVTGRKCLYISSIYNDAVEGLEEGPARRLIEELSAFAAQPKYMYRQASPWQAPAPSADATYRQPNDASNNFLIMETSGRP